MYPVGQSDIDAGHCGLTFIPGQSGTVNSLAEAAARLPGE